MRVSELNTQYIQYPSLLQKDTHADEGGTLFCRIYTYAQYTIVGRGQDLPVELARKDSQQGIWNRRP
jgi:hypothetical protein